MPKISSAVKTRSSCHVFSGLLEPAEAETLAWDVGNLEVRSRIRAVKSLLLSRRSIFVHKFQFRCLRIGFLLLLVNGSI